MRAASTRSPANRHPYVHDSRPGRFHATWHQVEDASAEQCVTLFREWIGAGPRTHLDHVLFEAAEFRAAARAELKGHDLVCWCPLDQLCHADVLLEVANGLEEA